MNVSTAGVGTPVVSAVEDVLAVIGTVLAAIAIVLTAIVAIIVVRRWRRRARRGPTTAAP